MQKAYVDRKNSVFCGHRLTFTKTQLNNRYMYWTILLLLLLVVVVVVVVVKCASRTIVTEFWTLLRTCRNVLS